MSSVVINCDTKLELDDSGCVHDESNLSNFPQVSLLDLSDDVLLYILRHCTPRDLKALGYSCPRLGRLIQERSLWRHVDARSEACSQARLKWFLDNTLHKDTHLLMVSGYARDTEGCLGLINVTRNEAAEEKRQLNQMNEPKNGGNDPNACEQIHEIPIPVHLERHHARFFISAQRTPHLPRFRGFPSWADETDLGRDGPDACKGPQFTLSHQVLTQLGANCPLLTTLVLEYCNIDCKRTSLGHFPKTLKKLSLRGTKCFNMSIDRSFLFKIQDYLPTLESLNVSECEWMDPATLLPLSKLATLEELIMRDCHKLAEFVAYASLTARYGFKTLKALDLRGSPVGDSEVSALGWLPRLEKLWLAATSKHASRPIRHHAHYVDDKHTPHEELYDWEEQEPDYFKSPTDNNTEDHEKSDLEASTSFDNDNQNNRLNTNNNLRGDQDKENGGKRKPEDGSGDSADINGSSPAVKRQKLSEENVETTHQMNENQNNLNANQIKAAENQFIPTQNQQNPTQNQFNVIPNQFNVIPNQFNVIPNQLNFTLSQNLTPDPNVPNQNFVAQNQFNVTLNQGNLGHDQNNLPQNQNFGMPNQFNVTVNQGNVAQNNNAGQNQNNEEMPKNRIMKIDCEINVNVIGVIETDDDEEVVGENVENNEEANRGNENPGNNGEAGNANDRPNQGNEGDRNAGVSPDCIVDCIKIDQLIDVGELRCGRQNEVIVIASTSRAKINNPTQQQDGYVHFRRNQEPEVVPEEPKKVEDDVQQNNLKRPNGNVNEGASTSKQPAKNEEPKEKYVCFRKNQEPVYVNCAPEPQVNQRREPLPPIQYQIEPRHHVLYVSVGPQLNTYRFPRDSSEIDRHLNLNFRPTHVDSSSLVTDFAIRRFGRADGEDVNIIHIGPNGPMVVGHDTGSRPDRSNLQFLSVTGYRNITDRSLVHLATAAPNLTRIDFTDTNISDRGAESFRSLRPDCDLTYSRYVEKKE